MSDARSWAAHRSSLLDEARGASPAQMLALLASIVDRLASNYVAYRVAIGAGEERAVELGLGALWFSAVADRADLSSLHEYRAAIWRLCEQHDFDVPLFGEPAGHTLKALMCSIQFAETGQPEYAYEVIGEPFDAIYGYLQEVAFPFGNIPMSSPAWTWLKDAPLMLQERERQFADLALLRALPIGEVVARMKAENKDAGIAPFARGFVPQRPETSS